MEIDRMKTTMKIFLITVVVMGNWFADADEETNLREVVTSDFAGREIQSCGDGNTFEKLVFDAPNASCISIGEAAIKNGILIIDLEGFNEITCGWYRLPEYLITSFNISTIQFSGPSDIYVLHQLVNEVPSYIKNVTVVLFNFERNFGRIPLLKFERFEKRVLSNSHTLRLVIKYGELNEIADGAIDMPALEYFCLMNTNVKDMKFVATLPKNLTDLEIRGHSKIIEIPERTFRNNAYLKTLDLGYNKIRDIKPGAFDNLHNLEHLDLSYNNITRLEVGVFVGLESLKTVMLQSNYIKNIASETFILPQLVLIDLENNLFDTIANGAVNFSSGHECTVRISYTPLCGILNSMSEWSKIWCFDNKNCSEYLLSPNLSQ